MIRTLSLACLCALYSLQPVTAQNPDLYDEGQLRTFSLQFAQSDWWNQLTNNYSAKKTIAADLTVDGILYKNVGVRFRGNTSYTLIGNSQKKPFKIVMDDFVPGQNLYGYKTINLNNSFMDPSYIRETLGYHILRQFVAAPKANYAKLTLNGANWGVYINVQQINETFAKEHLRGKDGNRYRGENKGGSVPPNDSALKWLGWSTTPYAAAYELKNNTPIDPWKDLIAACNALNNSGSNLRRDLPSLMDVDATLRYLVGINMLPCLDTYIGKSTHNFYLYTDSFHKRIRLLPWDLNACMGGETWMTESAKKNLSIWYRTNESDRPLLKKLLEVPEFRARYIAHYKTAIDEVFRWDRLQIKADQYRSLIASELTADPKKLYSISAFHDNLTKPVKINSTDTVSGVKPFVEGRRAYLMGLSEFRTPPVVKRVLHFPLVPAAAQPVTVLAQVTPTANVTVTLYERSQGAYVEHPMFDDGQHGDLAAGDGVFAGQIPGATWGVQKDFYVEARTGTGNGMRKAYWPPMAGRYAFSYRVMFPNSTSPIRVSEFLTSNKSGARDEKGELEDWIELRNPTSAPISIGGMFLTDTLDNPTRWPIPAGTTIPAGSTLLFWADGEPADGPLHATFKLDSNGEDIALFEADGKTLVDVFHYDTQIVDRSTGRLEDADPQWVTFAQPTPDRSNKITCGVRSYNSHTPWEHTVQATLAGQPKIGTTPVVQLRNARPGDTYFNMVQLVGVNLQVLPKLNLLTAPPLVWQFFLPADGQGAASFPIPIPNDTKLVGLSLFFQTLAIDPSSSDPNSIRGSNALELVLCK